MTSDETADLRHNSRVGPCRPEPHAAVVRGDVFPEVSHGTVYSAFRRSGRPQRFDRASRTPPGQSADPPVFVGAIGTRQADLDKLLRRLQGKTPALVFAYEAGPSGYGLHRYLTGQGLRVSGRRAVADSRRSRATR